MICSHCGRELSEGALFCRYCGCRQKVQSAEPAQYDLGNEFQQSGWTEEYQEGEPEEVQVAFKQISDIQDAGQIARAISMAEELAESYPDSYSAWMMVGFTNIEWDDYDRAIFGFEKALRLKPKDSDALGLIGVCYFEKEEYRTALQYLDQALEQKSNDDFMHTAISSSLEAEGTDAAIQRCGRYVVVAEDKEAMNCELGRCYGVKAFSYFTPAQDGNFYITSKEALDNVKKYTAKALFLMTREDLCADHIKDMKEQMESCRISEERIFQGHLCRAAVFWSILGIIFTTFLPFPGILLLAYGIIGIPASRIPQWRVNWARLTPNYSYRLHNAVADLFR